jgi:hypothetical protein
MTVTIGRRELLVALGGAAAAWPLAARAQPPPGKMVSVGILAIEAWPPIDAFRQALNDLGYVEGKNVRFEHRYAKGRQREISRSGEGARGPQRGHHSHVGNRRRARGEASHHNPGSRRVSIARSMAECALAIVAD